MESIAAFGLAANVLQFVDFVGRVFSQTIEIHRSASKTQDDAGRTDLDKLGFDFEDHLKQLAQRRLESPACLPAAEREMMRICRECEVITHKIRTALEKLKGPKRKIYDGLIGKEETVWRSFLEAIRTVWSEEEIRNLQQTLASYRQQITPLLVSALREEIQIWQSQQSNKQKSLYESTERVRNDMDRLLQEQITLKNELIQAIRDAYTYRRTGLETKHVLIHVTPQNMTQESLQRFHEGLLSRLYFTELYRRHEKIENPYEQTFRWIFYPSMDPKQSNFVHWLQSKSESLYWIAGKPAAGKSTLMKYIYEDSRTSRYLKEWAGQKSLIICSFFFWNSGEPIQRSKEGMIRTLLCAALRQQPELWSTLFPSKMEEFILLTDAWLSPLSSVEIELAFASLIQGAGREYKLFFLIDGLDEFNGNPKELVAMIGKLLLPDVKACVSSRPWVEFEDAYQRKPSLRLERLTYKDIELFVQNQFNNSIGFQDRQRENPADAQQLIENIILKASGVFLWVRLVTESLLEGFSDGERIQELQQRLKDLPGDLEELFGKILAQVKDNHRRQISQMLQITRSAVNQLDLLTFSYADDIDLEDVSSMVVTKDSDQVEARARNMRRRLRAFTKGLLEAEPELGQLLSEAKVGYLHRTVRDYIERADVWSTFLEATSPAFNPHARMCLACVVRLKTYSTYNFERNDGPGVRHFWTFVLRAIEYAVRADSDDKTGLQTILLGQLDGIATALATLKDPVDGSLLDRYHGPDGAWREHWSSTGSYGNNTFINLAVQLQLTEYLRNKISQNSIRATISDFDLHFMLQQALLDYDLFAEARDPSENLSIIYDKPNIDVIKILVGAGADPNHKTFTVTKRGYCEGDHSLWETHVRHRNRGSAVWSEISTFLLEHGADPYVIANDIPNIPHKVVALARTKQREMKRSRFSRLSGVFPKMPVRGSSKTGKKVGRMNST